MRLLKIMAVSFFISFSAASAQTSEIIFGATNGSGSGIGSGLGIGSGSAEVLEANPMSYGDAQDMSLACAAETEALDKASDNLDMNNFAIATDTRILKAVAKGRYYLWPNNERLFIAQLQKLTSQVNELQQKENEALNNLIHCLQMNSNAP